MFLKCVKTSNITVIKWFLNVGLLYKLKNKIHQDVKSRYHNPMITLFFKV